MCSDPRNSSSALPSPHNPRHILELLTYPSHTVISPLDLHPQKELVPSLRLALALKSSPRFLSRMEGTHTSSSYSCIVS